MGKTDIRELILELAPYDDVLDEAASSIEMYSHEVAGPKDWEESEQRANRVRELRQKISQLIASVKD